MPINSFIPRFQPSKADSKTEAPKVEEEKVETDSEVTKLSQEEEAEVHGTKCCVMMANKMQCARKIEYRKVTKIVGNDSYEKVDYFCEGHYQLLLSTPEGKKFRVRH